MYLNVHDVNLATAMLDEDEMNRLSLDGIKLLIDVGSGNWCLVNSGYLGLKLMMMKCHSISMGEYE